MKTRTPLQRLLTLVSVTVLGMTAGLFTAGSATAGGNLVVFAAASTTNAMSEIAALYTAAGNGEVTTSFASSSTLAKQIASGAPADVYLSANSKWMDFLANKALISTGTRRDLLSNRIVLIAPENSKLTDITIAKGFAMADLLGSDGRLSMGDPDHVPAGIYGKQALQNLDVWDRISSRLAPMKDVRAALVLVERAEAPVGLVYATDAAISSRVRVIGTFPDDSHPAIVYPVAAVADGKTDQARHFIDFLASPQAGAVFKQFGFAVH